MKKLILLLLLTVGYTAIYASNDITWLTSFDKAKKIAIQSNKFILINFYSEAQPNKINVNSWTDKEMKKMLDNYVPVQVEYGGNLFSQVQPVVRRYNVGSFEKALFIIDPFGNEVYRRSGVLTEAELKNILLAFQYDTEELKMSFENFTKVKNGKTALEIAKQYFKFSKNFKGKVKNKVIDLGEKYLQVSKDLSKKELSSKEKVQRIELLNSYALILKGKHKKALRFLNKNFTEQSIIDGNQKLYNVLNYVIYSNLNKKESADFWFQKINSGDEEAMQYTVEEILK